MDNFDTELGKLIDGLHAKGRLRVWSIVITIFGDCVVPRGGTISATTLAAITSRLKVEPVALRSALSRLAKDGWINREKDGRYWFYSLTDEGIQSFGPATRRIYASQPPEMPESWQIAISAPISVKEKVRQLAQMEEAGFTSLDNRIYIGQSDTPINGVIGDPAVFRGKFVDLPSWLSTMVGPPETAAAYEAIIEKFGQISKLDLRHIDPLDTVALRCLLIHQWRRAVLHHADLPLGFFPKDWPSEQARELVSGLYLALSPIADTWLDTAKELGSPSLDYKDRFKT